MDRREFFGWASRQGLKVGLTGLSIPALLAACGRDTARPARPAAGPTGARDTAPEHGEVLVGDVLDHALRSDDWPGPFGFVTFRLHRGVVDGADVFFIRTDASDEAFAQREGLVWAPKIGGLAAGGLTGEAYLFDGGPPDQATILSSEPGRPDYTPAWLVRRVRWRGEPRILTSVDQVSRATTEGAITVERTPVVLNAEVVKWSTGELPVDGDRTDYLGAGQVLEPPDTAAMTVTFKLHECFPEARYIVCDTSMAPMAEGMRVVHSPGLEETPSAEATGRTNVFMNGLPGPGPMGFQPSVFDARAGDPEWSPYWDHMTYAWGKGAPVRLLSTEAEIHQARDAGELDEFPGTPDTGGATFTVNCPVPVLAPNTFRG